ncbi:MAG: hypothetical protein ACYC91_07675 [Solirubrobacteraceae bacterium]
MGSLEELVKAGPAGQRRVLWALLAVARRPRGRRLLGHLGLAEQVAGGLLAMERYDDPLIARRLGFDAEAVVERGRQLRQSAGGA